MEWKIPKRKFGRMQRPRLTLPGGENLPRGRPPDVGIPIVVKRRELRQPGVHVMQVLHALPGRKDIVLLRKQSPRYFDDSLEPPEAAAAEQLERLSSGLRGERHEIVRTNLVARDAQRPRHGWIQRCGRRELSSVVDGG
jgi:hypothetical protein